MTQQVQQNPFDEYVERYGSHLGGLGICRFVHEQFLPEDESLDRWQIEVLFAFGEGERGISIAACHGPGKTAVAAWCIIYSLLFRFPLRAVATAPTKGQIEGALMSEVVKWIDKMHPGLQSLLEVKSTSVHLKQAPKRAYFEARTARPEAPEALQGVHEDEGWVFLLVDEASGVAEKIFESAAGSMSGENCQTMLLSNPTRTSGFFFGTHTREKSNWFALRVSHEDSTRVTDKFVEEMALRYGRESNQFRVRVLGLFPRSDLDTLIPFELADTARTRDIVVPPRMGDVWALDVARFGDDDSVLLRRNRISVRQKIMVWNGLDTMETAAKVHEEYRMCQDHEKPSSILVDVIGIGAGVVDRLYHLGLPVRGVNVSETASAKDEYRNLRTELAFLGKAWLERRDTLLPQCDGTCRDRQSCVHERLVGEITTMKYDVTQGGKLLLESKRDMKKRGFKSPDVGDAFFLSFAEEPATLIHGSGADGGWGNQPAWNQPFSRGLSMV